MLEQYITYGQKKLRCGYTTGTCAAAAARAAAEALLCGVFPPSLTIGTPAGIQVTVSPEECVLGADFARCAVRKDGGDDCDVTNGALIAATVRKTERGITISGGDGVGRVTRPGLNQPVGEAAINRVPREMITRQLQAALKAHGADCGLHAEISVPQGAALAKKTFNPRLGIEGGISILGSTGIVRPMSKQALVDTIRAELEMHRAEGVRDLLMTPGNYGADFAQNALGLDIRRAVECSNYVGEAVDLAVLLGFSSILLVGHVGKLCKLAASVMDTHSRSADARREVFVTHAALLGASGQTLRALYEAATTDAALDILLQEGLAQQVLDAIAKAAGEALSHRAGGVRTELILFSQAHSLTAQTDGAAVLARLHTINHSDITTGGTL